MFAITVTKTRILTIYIVSLILLGTNIALSQENIPSVTPSQKAIETTSGRWVGYVSIYFNERLNETASQVEFPIYGKPLNGIYLKVRNVSAGKLLTRADTLEFLILTTGPDRVYLDDFTFKLELDGKEVISSISTLRSDQSQGRYFSAVFVKNISYDDFVKITEAKQVQMQIGPTTLRLKEDDLAALRDLLKTIQ